MDAESPQRSEDLKQTARPVGARPKTKKALEQEPEFAFIF